MLKFIAHLPIRVKLMATTLALVVFTVGLYGLMNLRDLRRVHDESRDAQQDMVLENVTADAQNVMLALRSTAAIFLSSSAYGDLEALVGQMRRQDARLVFVRVVDVDGRAVVTSGEVEGSRAGTTVLPAPQQAKGAVKVELLGREGVPRLLVAEAPIESASGGIAGRVEAGWSIAHLADRNAAIAARVEERKDRSAVNALVLGALLTVLAAILTVLQSLRITRPIRDLTDSVERIAHGELKERVRIDTSDELGVLARNFNYMAERIGVLLKDTKEKATLEKELEVARVIQESLLPPSTLIDVGFVQFQGFFRSASICGGDWWSYAKLPGGKVLILIGDVTGHGVSSAMITAAAKSCCDTLRHVTEGELTVTFLLEELNKTIYEAANRKFVMTFFATILDPAKRTITFSNAGHNFPLLFRAQPRPDEPNVVPLVTRGNRLGDVMESRFVERTVGYEAGDVLVWYTDGLTEGENDAREAYGEKRLRRSVQATVERGPDAILERILKDAEGYFSNFARPEDAITLVVAKFKAGGAPTLPPPVPRPPPGP